MEDSNVIPAQPKGPILAEVFNNGRRPQHFHADRQKHCITDVKSLDEKMVVAARTVFSLTLRCTLHTWMRGKRIVARPVL